MRRSWPLVTLAAACSLALGACSKQAENAAVPPGASGSGTQGSNVPGTGLNGGLGTGAAQSAQAAASSGSAVAGGGSPNATTGSSFGNRP